MPKWLFLLVSFLVGATPVFPDSHCQPIAFSRFLSPGEQSFEVVERLGSPNETETIYIEFGDFVGPYPKVFAKITYDQGCFANAILHGSYEYLTEKTDGGEVRTYHLDYYGPDSHATLGFYDSPLSFEEFRIAADK